MIPIKQRKFKVYKNSVYKLQNRGRRDQTKSHNINDISRGVVKENQNSNQSENREHNVRGLIPLKTSAGDRGAAKMEKGCPFQDQGKASKS